MSLAKSRRLAAHYAKQAAAHVAAINNPVPKEPPKSMELGVTPDHICRAFWVYLNGVRQTTCRLAIVGNPPNIGYVERWPTGRGGLSDKSQNTEKVYGVVEIVPAGFYSKFLTKG